MKTAARAAVFICSNKTKQKHIQHRSTNDGNHHIPASDMKKDRHQARCECRDPFLPGSESYILQAVYDQHGHGCPRQLSPHPKDKLRNTAAIPEDQKRKGTSQQGHTNSNQYIHHHLSGCHGFPLPRSIRYFAPKLKSMNAIEESRKLSFPKIRRLPTVAAAPSAEEKLLTEIRDLLKNK